MQPPYSIFSKLRENKLFSRETLRDIHICLEKQFLRPKTRFTRAIFDKMRHL